MQNFFVVLLLVTLFFREFIWPQFRTQDKSIAAKANGRNHSEHARTVRKLESFHSACKGGSSKVLLMQSIHLNSVNCKGTRLYCKFFLLGFQFITIQVNLHIL
jgi:hypothetical protein